MCSHPELLKRVTAAVGTKNYAQVRHYYYRLVRKVNKALAPCGYFLAVRAPCRRGLVLRSPCARALGPSPLP